MTTLAMSPPGPPARAARLPRLLAGIGDAARGTAAA